MNSANNSANNTRKSLVIIGNGMVAGRFIDDLLKHGADKFDITVIGAEPQGSYNRIMLSSVLAKDASTFSIIQKDATWYAEHNIDFKAATLVTSIDREQRHVITDQGERIAYDELVIATGSRAARIPAKNSDLNNIFLFRTIADTEAMMSMAEQANTILVVGGGLLGLEAAYGLAKYGAKVTLVHRSQWLLNRQLDERAGAMLQHVMHDMGITFKLGCEVSTFDGNDSVSSATLSTGETLTVDMAVIATGITPNKELGLACGLEGHRAIAVNETMQSSDAQISAIGECIEYNGDTFGLVDPLWRQAETLALRLTKGQALPFTNLPIATKLKVSGVQVFSAGDVESREDLRELYIEDNEARIYRKLLLKNNRIQGIVLFGDVSSGQYYFDLMQEQHDISAMLPTLIFGEAFLHKAATNQNAA